MFFGNIILIDFLVLIVVCKVCIEIWGIWSRICVNFVLSKSLILIEYGSVLLKIIVWFLIIKLLI